ncbi:hypothetical protein T12_13149 [Trichinella patagoniensis]|uniref:Uncharacterized protein n=1 Tax=Trichinella patagoniensis TaxID=990121 RepID=A0A0V1A070_9BILA|nr:hypothetical protein T12_13149 [Trichinella patagoniensis]
MDSILSTKLLFKYTAPGVQIGPYNPSSVVNKYEWKVILLTFTMAISHKLLVKISLLQNISKELHLSRISRSSGSFLCCFEKNDESLLQN